ncbi:MAG: gliding motility-associated C-terminal domain-containing protein [Sphingobacteriales bacterium]|nr:gliding motility-associated C-terminal domain-containing protein [Sphingobacteriales bacterium]
MNRFVLAFLFVLTGMMPAKAAHIIGGEMRYTYVSAGVSPNSKIYRITLILYRGDDPTGAQFAPTYVIGIFNNDNGSKITGTAANNNWLVTQEIPPGIQDVPIVLPTCIQGAPSLNYTYASYSLTIELPVNMSGYTAAYQTCCRINGLMNIGNSTGSTYSCRIPGTNNLNTGNDSSPRFFAPINVICKNAPFTLNFSASDPDSDSLEYSLCNAFNGGASVNAGFDDPAGPPYGSVNYTPPYTSGNPFGTGATINSQTGVISGLAPDFGRYVISVCITVFRNGVPIGSHRKDLIVQVSDCILTIANPLPDFVTCDGFDVQFSHTSTGASSVFWDFGVTTQSNDTANINNPSFTYPDTGLYNVKFVINRGSSCSDSAIRKVGVYPGFSPGFVVTGNCFINPFRFTDTTNTRYGFVNSWSWNFGDLGTLADTAHINNPQWTYPAPGNHLVSLIVTSNKGCRDTASMTVNVLDKPLLTLAFRDTLICINDALQLQAAGTGSFSWTPLVNIVNANTSSPTVSPPVTTWYYVALNDNGCLNQDSVQVRVISAVTLAAMNDTTICQGDTIRLRAVSNGLTYNWSPAAGLDNATIINPRAVVNTSTVFTVTATVGGCNNSDQVLVTTIPYPVANAGNSPVICYNTAVQLNASITGNSFTWTPSNFLDDPTVLNPVATPPRTTQYILSAFDTRGCPKPGRDTLVVTVLPRVIADAGPDTTVVIGQTLQFNGTGGTNYVWSPGTGLNNTLIAGPVGVYNGNFDSIRYKLLVTDAAGCADSAFVTVRIFKTAPSVFVPTAFTPNNDGLNDVVKPIAVGMKKINYFSVYNRWGQLVFTTPINGHGWDGRIRGILQGTGVFVWMVSAEDYTGRPYFQKGTVTLIR